MINRIILNETSYFGRGSREKISEEIKGRKLKKALVVTDSGIAKSGVLGMVTAYLDQSKIPYAIFDKVKPNPTVSIVKEGLELA